MVSACEKEKFAGSTDVLKGSIEVVTEKTVILKVRTAVGGGKMVILKECTAVGARKRSF